MEAAKKDFIDSCKGGRQESEEEEEEATVALLLLLLLLLLFLPLSIIIIMGGGKASFLLLFSPYTAALDVKGMYLRLPALLKGWEVDVLPAFSSDTVII